MTSLRLLTWNVQLFSWGAMVAKQGNLAPVNNATERADEIARRLVNDPEDWDVVGLSEVWHEGTHDIFDEDTTARYPHRIAKADDGVVRIGTSGAASTPYLTAILNEVVAGTDVSDAWTFEDSGLELLSQIPFDTVSTAGLSAELHTLSAQLMLPVPAVVPAVAFLPYADSDDDDSMSRKGLLYARLKPAGGGRMHVFLTHTQADYTSLHQYAGVRAKQFAFVEKSIRSIVGDPPFAEEVFLMGDLNVPGEQWFTAGPAAEWRTLFAAPGRLLADDLVETWGTAQCRGPVAPDDPADPAAGPIGLRDPGQTATSAAPPPTAQRLDYHFISRTSGLTAQHVRTRWDLSRPPSGMQYLSDHLPLSIDLAPTQPHSSPQTARAVPDADIARSNWSSGEHWLVSGAVAWFRFDRSGSYDFRVLTHAGVPARMELYADTDLSRPFSHHLLTPANDWGDRFIVKTAPMLLKVFADSRRGETRFEVRGRRHVGEDAFTAIDVPWRFAYPEAHPDGDVLNAEDAKWFRLTGTMNPLPQPVRGRLRVRRTRGAADFTVAVHRWDGGALPEISSGASDALGLCELDVELPAGEDLRFAIVRRDAAHGPLEYEILVETDVTFVLGGSFESVRLTCTTETGGWSCDDIEVDWNLDGRDVAYIDEDTIDGFWQDMTQDIAQYLPNFGAYWNDVHIRLIEKDAISKDDIGRATINPWETMSLGQKIAFSSPAGDDSVRDVLQDTTVDDGEYRLSARFVTWDPRI